MQLITILLVAVAILTLLSGISVMAGVSKKQRINGVWFFVATIFGAVWSISMAIFLNLPINTPDTTASATAFTIYASVIFADVALLGYICWHYRFGKICTLLFLAAGIVIADVILHNPELMYNGIILSREGNQLDLNYGWFFMVVLSFFGMITTAFTGFLIYRILHARDRGERVGHMVFLIGLSVSGLFSLLFDMIQIIPSLTWLGPLVMSIVILSFYYAILRYRILRVSSFWLKALSYVNVIASATILYMIIFFVIFAALFHAQSPSATVILLNFIMIFIVLLLMPVISEFNASIRSLLSVNKVDLAYVIKKLNRIAPRNANLKELSGFLAEHLHFNYIGFIINGRLYSSNDTSLSNEEIKAISALKTNEHGVWQTPNPTVTKIFIDENINAVAELRNAKGQVFGQILVGNPTGKKHFERHDLVQLEMIINIVANVVYSSKRTGK